MKTVSDLLVQFVGFLLQTAPVVFFCVITIREVSSAYSARRLLLHACGIELLGGALFTALCGWGAGTGQLMLLCNLFMIAMLVAVLIWLKHVSRVNLCQLAILGTLFVHYAAVVYTCNGICFFLLAVLTRIRFFHIVCWIFPFISYAISAICRFLCSF